MQPTEYIKLTGITDHDEEAADTMGLRMDLIARPMHYALGLCTEVGELQDALKKYVAYGKDFDKTNIKEELGDILWYVARMCNYFDLTLEECMERNIEKLKARYGDKFTEHAALNRDLAKEREVLEK
jgi:NTP pyrophosphatase (non-canonical NTP hydrolase)